MCVCVCVCMCIYSYVNILNSQIATSTKPCVEFTDDQYKQIYGLVVAGDYKQYLLHKIDCSARKWKRVCSGLSEPNCQ